MPGHLIVDDESCNTYKAISVKETPSPSLKNVSINDSNWNRNDKKNNSNNRNAESPTEKVFRSGAKFHKVRAVTTNREILKEDVKKKIEKVLHNNLKSGSYVLEQDGSIGSDPGMTNS